MQFTYDFTGDGWPDVINSLFTQPTVMYVNPRGESRRWEMFTVTDRITSELALMKDVNGDGKLDYLFKDANNQFVYANPDPANPTGTWVTHAISTPGPWANHGMGVGDVNGDGRLDFVNAYGWWERTRERQHRDTGPTTRAPSARGPARALAEPRLASTTSTATG